VPELPSSSAASAIETWGAGASHHVPQRLVSRAYSWIVHILIQSGSTTVVL